MKRQAKPLTILRRQLKAALQEYVLAEEEGFYEAVETAQILLDKIRRKAYLRGKKQDPLACQGKE